MSAIQYAFNRSILQHQSVVPIDGAGPLWQCANQHSSDYLRGNCGPASSAWVKLLNNLRSLCNLRCVVYMDGRFNPHKRFEEECRQNRASTQCSIRNTPEYIAQAVHVCNFLQIEVVMAPYEADPQVM
jgi:hypothetical protein